MRRPPRRRRGWRCGRAPKKGDVLLVIDDVDHQARVAQAQGELAAARAQLDAATANEQVSAASARGGLSSAQATLSGSSQGVANADAQRRRR